MRRILRGFLSDTARVEDLVDPAWIWLPIILTAGAVSLTLMRIRTGDRGNGVGSSRLLTLTLLLYFTTLILVTLLSNGRVVPREIFLVPFSDLEEVPNMWAQSLANTLLFVPFGLLLPLKWPAFRSLSTILLVGTVTSITIEAAQYMVGNGRETSSTDVILNALGVLVGYALFRASYLPHARKPNTL
jgi:glycopeptide antibiotics resistance protein